MTEKKTEGQEPTSGHTRRNEQEFLATTQIAKITGVHRNTVYNWINRDGLRHYRSPSGYIFIKRKDLEQFLRVVQNKREAK